MYKIFQLSRHLFLFKLALALLLVAFNSPVLAHYHSGFLFGFDEYAKLHGYDSFSGYIKQKSKCVDLVNDAMSQVESEKNAVGVLAPVGYHWMKNEGQYELMKNPYGGYTPHKGSSIKANIKIYSSYTTDNLGKTSEYQQLAEATKIQKIEVDPPKGYHWMKVGENYELMKNPYSGYSPHKNSSLKAEFRLFSPELYYAQKPKVKNDQITIDMLEEKIFNLSQKIIKTNVEFISSAIKSINKDVWSKERCAFSMLMDVEQLAPFLEEVLMESKKAGTGMKREKKKSYGSSYGY